VFPFIGHIGLCRYSNGHIFDFSGPYQITRHQMLFGWPVRYLPLELVSLAEDELQSQQGATHDEQRAKVPALGKDIVVDEAQEASNRRTLAQQYDNTLEEITQHYEERMMYNLLLRNCHHFCCDVLNGYEKGLANGFDERERHRGTRSVCGQERSTHELEPFEEMMAQELSDEEEDSSRQHLLQNPGDSTRRRAQQVTGSTVQRSTTPKTPSRIALSLHGIENDWMFRLTKSMSQFVFGKQTWWNIAALAWLTWWYGRYVSTGRMIYTLVPVIVIWTFALVWVWFVARALLR